MDLLSGIEIGIFFLGICLFLLQIFAYFNIDKKTINPQWHSLNLFWLFHEEIYTEAGKAACRYARRILFVALVMFAFWGLLKVSQ